jgi:iron complex outermembrane receptor protein
MSIKYYLAAMACVVCPLALADAAPEVVVVSASRAARPVGEVAASVDVLDATRIGEDQMRVNVSEALAAVPGLFVQNRQNYAQDLQISSRGFGARSAFGVRGIRLVTDGIPATMPDGQGQAATFNLDMAERIEVLRGPAATLYGNHAGGVIALFTRDVDGPPTFDTTALAGSDGTRKLDVNAAGKSDGLTYLLDSSRFETDGYRDHSAASREQAYAKLTVAPSAGGKLSIVANGLRQADTQDPLGVSWATVWRDPRAGEIDPSDTQNPKRTFAERYDTRKTIRHQQIGTTFEQQLGDDTLRAMLYGGNRRVVQFQSFSQAFQAAPSQSGGVVDFDRRFYGADISYLVVRRVAGGQLSALAGVETGRSNDARLGFENFIGAVYGVQGRLRRDEQDGVANVEPYLQGEWKDGNWQASGGLRYSRVRFNVRDQFLSNGDDSGHLVYGHLTPMLGLAYLLQPRTRVYVSAASGFETPTLNELFYSGRGSGFNFNLKAATSVQLETGVKAALADNFALNAALFQTRTKDELVVDAASGGRTSYRNASRTLRQGGELSLEAELGHSISARLSATTLRAVYDTAFGAVPAGSRLPGIPNANLYADVNWSGAWGKLGLESVIAGRVYADDANAEPPAPAYAIANLHWSASQSAARWRFRQFVRINNVADRHYVGSVIVGDANKRFYEPAPGRNWQIGLGGRYSF